MSIASGRKRKCVVGPKDGEVIVKAKSDRLSLSISQPALENSFTDIAENGENFSPGTRNNLLNGYASSNLALCGKLEKLVLKNFMNHRHLEVPFGDKINFVVGKNGSGKSAIVTALLVGLGARASLTQRSGSVGGLIRKGESAATIAIHLSNVGKNPFQPEVFGNRIILERRITHSSNSYKIKDSREKVVGNSAHFMHRILEHFDICIDNPTTILTQDNSREFLATAEPSKMYSFFKQATRLDVIEQDLEFVRSNIEQSEKHLERRRTFLSSFEEDIKKVQSRIKACDTKVEMEEKVKRLQGEAVIVDKKDLEAKKFQLERRIEAKQREIHVKDDQIKAFVSEVDTLTAEENAAAENIARLQQQQKSVCAEKSEKETRIREKNRELEALSMTIQGKQNTVNSSKMDIRALQIKADQIKLKNQQDFVEQRAKLTERLKGLEHQIEEGKVKGITTELSARQTNQKVDETMEALRRVRLNHSRFEADAKQLDSRIRQLLASKGNALKAFGQYVPEVLAAIEQSQHLFSETPRGPLGRYIAASEPKYELAIELCLGQGIMKGFLCNNRRDVEVLRRIFDRIIGVNNRKFHPQITVQKFVSEVYDTTRFKSLTSDFPTLLDVIRCDDSVVTNCIIDQTSPENILVFESLQIARRTLIINEAPGQTSKGVCVDGSEILPRKAVYPKSNAECRFFQRDDISGKIKVTEENLAACNAEIKSSAVEMRNLESKLQTNRSAQLSLMKEKASIEHNVSVLESQASSLKRELKEMVTDETVHIYEDEIGKETEKLDSLQQDLAQSAEKLEKLKSVIAELRVELGQVVVKVQEVNSEFRDLRGGFEKVVERKVEKQEMLKFYSGKVQLWQRELGDDRAASDQLQNQIEALEHKLNRYNLSAEDLARLMRSRRSKDEVLKHVKDLKEALAQKKKETPDNKEDLERDLAVKNENYRHIVVEIERTEELLLSLQDAVKFREKKFVSLRDSAASTMANGFAHRLSLRENGYSGQLLFNHEEKSLDILVRTSRTNGALKNNSQLSGGERSFTTVCFITAMWSAVSASSPFKILDEFDVFMDMINRKLSMDYLLEFAAHEGSSDDCNTGQMASQFIFLTPLDLSNLEVEQNSRKIFRMPDPERVKRQSRLDQHFLSSGTQ